MCRRSLNGMDDRAPRRKNIESMWVFCRIGYHLATPGLAALARQAHIYREQKFSDHAPLMIDYDFQL